jgi:hypothetical protein
VRVVKRGSNILKLNQITSLPLSLDHLPMRSVAFHTPSIEREDISQVSQSFRKAWEMIKG